MTYINNLSCSQVLFQSNLSGQFAETPQLLCSKPSPLRPWSPSHLLLISQRIPAAISASVETTPGHFATHGLAPSLYPQPPTSSVVRTRESFRTGRHRQSLPSPCLWRRSWSRLSWTNSRRGWRLQEEINQVTYRLHGSGEHPCMPHTQDRSQLMY